MSGYLKKIGIGVAILLGVLLIAVVGYVAYVFFTYDRIEDNQVVEIENQVKDTMVKVGETYTALTYNIGFGAYSDDYSFFMDGGKYSRAFNKDSVLANTKGSIDVLKGYNPDLILLQEVDVKSTRSYGVNQREMLAEAFPDMASAFAVNFDSAYLMYPFTTPHGKSLSGMNTLSKFTVESSLRRSLPISTSFYKFLDLDRCYTITRIPVENGKELCVYNVHLSAYTDDVAIVTNQVKMLSEDLKADYEAGNYIICGGDFNQDLLGNSPEIFKTEESDANWAKPFASELLPEGVRVAYSLLGDEVRSALTPSCRNADSPYKEGESFVTMVDGFILSDNIDCLSIETVDSGFQYSDHNPVKLEFRLK